MQVRGQKVFHFVKTRNDSEARQQAQIDETQPTTIISHLRVDSKAPKPLERLNSLAILQQAKNEIFTSNNANSVKYTMAQLGMQINPSTLQHDGDLTDDKIDQLQKFALRKGGYTRKMVTPLQFRSQSIQKLPDFESNQRLFTDVKTELGPHEYSFGAPPRKLQVSKSLKHLQAQRLPTKQTLKVLNAYPSDKIAEPGQIPYSISITDAHFGTGGTQETIMPFSTLSGHHTTSNAAKKLFFGSVKPAKKETKAPKLQQKPNLNDDDFPDIPSVQMSRQERMFLKNEAKHMENLIGPDQTLIPMSRHRIRNLISKMKLKPLGSASDSGQELQEALLASQREAIFTARLYQALDDNRKEMLQNQHNERLMKVFEANLREQRAKRANAEGSQSSSLNEEELQQIREMSEMASLEDPTLGRFELQRILKNEDSFADQSAASEVQGMSPKQKQHLKDIVNKPSKHITSTQTNNFYTGYKLIHKIKQKDDTKPSTAQEMWFAAPQKSKVGQRDKSPILEYLKQVDKDKQLPLFVPFKNVANASDFLKSEETPTSKTAGLKFVLDSFNITCEIAPSLAQSLKNVNRLQMLSLVDSMLCDQSFEIIVRGIPLSLISLDLSRNENLTARSYEKLQSIRNLRYLNVEQNYMGDECLAALLQIKQDPTWNPVKLFNGINITPEAILSLTGKNEVQIAPYKVISQYEQVESFFRLIGLVTTLKSLNISRNKITDAGVKHLQNFLMCSRHLQTLLLHWNSIRAPGAQLIAKQLKINKTLKVLDVSFNSFANGLTRRITVKRPEPEKGKLGDETTAISLNLQSTFNKHIIDPTFKQDFKYRQRLPIFECSEVAWKWRKALMRNMHLLHLDISHNQFKPEDSEAMADGLKENHTLLGIHTVGNHAEVDHLGFMSVNYDDKSDQVLEMHHFARLPPTHQRQKHESSIVLHDQALRVTSSESEIDFRDSIHPFDLDSESSVQASINKVASHNCWVCEGYVEVMFELTLPERFYDINVESVFLHLEFENYEPTVMKKKDLPPVPRPTPAKQPLNKARKSVLNIDHANLEVSHRKLYKQFSIQPPTEQAHQAMYQPQVFYLWRMLPPNQAGVKHFFSFQNPSTLLYETYVDQDSTISPQEESDGIMETDRSADPKQLKPPRCKNITEPLLPARASLVDRDVSTMLAKPRQLFNASEKQRPKTAWAFETSSFAAYKVDNEQLMWKCFEFDWKSGIFDKMIKQESERSEIKNFLRQNYMLIREAYKHLACAAPAGIIPSIGMNSLSELLLKAKDFVDYQNIKLSDVDLAFIATNASTSRVHQHRIEECNNPERQLIRFQFLEVLMRLAFERFHKKPPSLKMSDSIKTFFTNYMFPVFEKYSSHPWRVDKYWNEQCDNVIKDYETTLKDIYYYYALPLSPGGPKIMRLNTFIELITATGVTSDQFGAREISQLFGISMQTHVDEIYSNGHMDMRFIEFVEAVARVADKALETKKRKEAVTEQAAEEDGDQTKKNSTVQQPNASLAQSNQGHQTEEQEQAGAAPIKTLGQILRELRAAKEAQNEAEGKSPVIVEKKPSSASGMMGSLQKAFMNKIVERSQEADDQDNEDQHLSAKLQKYIRRIATQCMGTAYAVKFLKEESRRQKQRDLDFLNQNKVQQNEQERLAAMGLRAQLIKVKQPKGTVSPSPKKTLLSPLKVTKK